MMNETTIKTHPNRPAISLFCHLAAFILTLSALALFLFFDLETEAAPLGLVSLAFSAVGLLTGFFARRAGSAAAAFLINLLLLAAGWYLYDSTIGCCASPLPY